MGNDIPLDKAELLSTLLEGILYGFSLLMFGATIWVLFSRRPTQRVNRSMVTVACSLLLCSTAHLVIDIVRINEGLVLHRDDPGGPIAFFSSVSHWTFVSKNYLYAIQTLIGDGVILYRCSVVWQSKPVMVLPTLLWCATGVTGIASAYTESQLTTGDDVFSEILSAWIKAFYATAFTTNISATFLLVYRIWNIDRKTTDLRGQSKNFLRETLHIIIDAGVIYFAILLALMICFSVQSNGQFVVLNMIVPIISITFYMVIIRVGMFNLRGNQPASTVDSFCAGARYRLQVRDTPHSENMPNDGRWPPDPIITINNESRRDREGIKFNNTKEAV